MSQPNADFAPAPTVVKATLTALPDGDPICVHFNPASLVYTVENSSPQQGGDPKRRQFAAQFTGKLTMDLQFDTTDTGADVREVTNQVALFMQSSADANKGGKSGNGGANKPAPAVLSFSWGAYQFQGLMESFKETIDFFSADGIPLRALVSIGLARQDNVFDPGSGASTDVSGSLVPTPENGDVGKISSQGGDQNATRALASANGIENPRFTGGASLNVSGGIQLNPAVAFVASASVSAGIGVSGGAGVGVSGGLGLSLTSGASVSAGVSIGASASAGVSAGVGTGVSGGVSASAGAGISLGVGVSVSSTSGGQVTLAAGGGALFGSKASAGVAATQGAFAGLEVGRATVSTTAQLDPLRMLPATVGSNVSASAGSSFGLGGIALAKTGFSTDVGATFSVPTFGSNNRLIFDSD
jgi:Contractile injection system tube protein